jgi:hypothetical protein
MRRSMLWSLPAAAVLVIAAGGVPADAAKLKSKQTATGNNSKPINRTGDRSFYVDETGILRPRKKQLQTK